MDLKERLKRSLLHSRWFTEHILDELQSSEDWVRRPVPGTNHALWIAGHLVIADNAFIGMVDASQKVVNEQYKQLFGKGSQPQDNHSAYPTPTDVRAAMSERRSVLMELLANCTDADFERPTPEGAPPFMYDVGAVFQMAAWHESLHGGQLTVIHRLLGHDPIADRPAATSG